MEKKKIIIIVISVVVLMVIGLGIFFYFNNKKDKTKISKEQYNQVELQNTEETAETEGTNETKDSETNNEEDMADLTITLVGDDNKPLQGAIFNIYDEEGYRITQLTTDENGETGILLKYGTRYIKQESTVEKYIMDDTLYRVVSDSENKTFKLDVTNQRYKGILALTVSDNKKNAIEGVKYNVLDQNGEIIANITTNELGRAGVANMPFGTYYYQQAEPKEGYTTDEQKHKFIIEENDKKVMEYVILENN